LAAALALGWNSRVAAHLVALAALWWWYAAALGLTQNPFIITDGAALLLGAGLLLANSPSESLRSFGITLSIYGAFALAALAALAVLGPLTSGDRNPPAWAVGCGLAGMVLAFAAATRRVGSIFAGISIALVLVVANRLLPGVSGESWIAYALEL